MKLRRRLRKLIRLSAKSALALGVLTTAARADKLLLLVGAPGEPAYAEGFAATVATWQENAAKARMAVSLIDGTGEASARERLQQWIAENAKDFGSENLDTPDASTGENETTWIVYVGHGTYDGQVARLNLPGPDVSAAELATWLLDWKTPLVFVHGGSASAPFVTALSREDRIIVAATESGNEVNFARFGRQFARSVTDPAADIDRDGQTSVLEAFVTASNQVQAFYTEHDRLATEHAIIDDNGDGRGTPYDFFHGTRVVRDTRDAAARPDGGRARLLALLPAADQVALTAEQRETRDQLEATLETLRQRKSELAADQYYAALEALFRQLGELYRTAPESSPPDS